MQIILTKNCESLTGRLFGSCGYTIKSRTMRDGKRGFFAVRQVPYNCYYYKDDRHATFIRLMAEQAVGTNPSIEDIRVTVREFVDARVSLVSGSPLVEYDVGVRRNMLAHWCGIITMRLRKVKPNSVLTAKDIVMLKNYLLPVA